MFRRIGNPGDVALVLEVPDEHRHGLLRHLRAFGEEADRRGVVEVLDVLQFAQGHGIELLGPVPEPVQQA